MKVQEEHAVQMLFSAAPPAYADSEDGSEAKATRAATADWPDRARLYLRFNDNGATGTATYNAATRQWTLSFTGSLAADEDSTCEVWYFENPASADATSATLSPTTATFHTDSAIYLYHSDVVHLRASLEPTEARLRYKGTPGTILTVADWPHYATFTRSTSSFSNSAEDYTFTLTVGSDGYTPYIYGHNNIALLHVEISETPYFLLLSDTDAQSGRSYSTSVPTESLVYAGKWSHTSRDRTFTVTGNGKTVTFKMIYIEGGTFQMGASNISKASPVHTVNISKDYYMCETEVTQALWYAVMGQSPTSGGDHWSSTCGFGDNRPAYNISYDDCQSFLSALKSKLSSQLGSGEQFRFPTEAEWEFAAKGGNKSKGYTYAGSNTIDDVAWYYDNSYALGSSNSNYGTHVVKTKSPNELGLYDMSGNVFEWCYDWYGSYNNSDTQKDPTGPTSGSNRVYRGGSWHYYVTYCRVASRDWNTSSFCSDNLGFRLCLGAPIGQ